MSYTDGLTFQIEKDGRNAPDEWSITAYSHGDFVAACTQTTKQLLDLIGVRLIDGYIGSPTFQIEKDGRNAPDEWSIKVLWRGELARYRNHTTKQLADLVIFGRPIDVRPRRCAC